MKKTRRRATIGDVSEINTPIGLAYFQYTDEHPVYGGLIRVLPGAYAERPSNLATLLLTFGVYAAKLAICVVKYCPWRHKLMMRQLLAQNWGLRLTAKKQGNSSAIEVSSNVVEVISLSRWLVSVNKS